MRITIILFILVLLSCKSGKVALKTDEEGIRLCLDIIDKELNDIAGITIRDYRNLQLLATLEQRNLSDTTVALTAPRFIVYENYEIKDLRDIDKENLINQYDYSIVFDPESYEFSGVELKSDEFMIDTLDIAPNFNFYLSETDTFLIRLKKYYFDQYYYSNWDTLIIR